MSLFKPIENPLVATVFFNALWEIGVYNIPTHYSKHMAKEVYMHRLTAQFTPEIWVPENTTK